MPNNTKIGRYANIFQEKNWYINRTDFVVLLEIIQPNMNIKTKH